MSNGGLSKELHKLCKQFRHDVKSICRPFDPTSSLPQPKNQQMEDLYQISYNLAQLSYSLTKPKLDYVRLCIDMAQISSDMAKLSSTLSSILTNQNDDDGSVDVVDDNLSVSSYPVSVKDENNSVIFHGDKKYEELQIDTLSDHVISDIASINSVSPINSPLHAELVDNENVENVEKKKMHVVIVEPPPPHAISPSSPPTPKRTSSIGSFKPLKKILLRKKI